MENEQEREQLQLIISPTTDMHAAISFLNFVLLALLPLKYQNKGMSLFEAHGTVILLYIVAASVYSIALILRRDHLLLETLCFVTLEYIALLSGALTCDLLLLILSPPFGYFLLALSGVLVLLRALLGSYQQILDHLLAITDTARHLIPHVFRRSSRQEAHSQAHSMVSQSITRVSINHNSTDQRDVVLDIGGGGREQAPSHALQRSPSCEAVSCAPGNAGISNSRNSTCIQDLDVSDSSAVISFCRNLGVGLVVVGLEAPLVSGLANTLVKAGIPTFGPSAEAAALGGSKNFMKNLCDKYEIPTVKYQTFTDPSAAKQYIQDQGESIVIKADGLAAGKGVIVATTLEEAYEAVDSMLVKSTVYGSAGCRVIVEEFLEGEEASFFALVDGENAIPLESAQDHKRVGDGDIGLNTEGMGAYSPAPVLTKELQSVIMETIILPTVKGMAAEGYKFVGLLYAGLMIEKMSVLPKLNEYSVCYGDPECQVLMVRLESDLVQILLAASRGELSGESLKWSPGSAMVVVMASKGYPGSYEKETVIRNLEEAENIAPTVKIFHAGTALISDHNLISTRGRVLGVTATGRDLEEIRDRAYQAVEEINWPGGFYRRDIGWRALPPKQLAPETCFL